MLGLLRGASFRPAGKTGRAHKPMRASKAVEAAPAAERDLHIEQASRPLDFLNTSLGDGRQRRLVLGADIGSRGATAVLDETGESGSPCRRPLARVLAAASTFRELEALIGRGR